MEVRHDADQSTHESEHPLFEPLSGLDADGYSSLPVGTRE